MFEIILIQDKAESGRLDGHVDSNRQRQYLDDCRYVVKGKSRTWYNR